jgi:hypothetical protein
MRIDGKPNVAPNLTTAIIDEDRKDTVRDVAGAMVRPTREDAFIPEVDHHRMTREFRDFARMIDNHETANADQYMQETIEAMKIIAQAAE